jgi:transcriptional regulator with XRE-family HTH domain
MYETDQRVPEPGILQKLAGFSNVTVDYLLGSTGTCNPYSGKNYGGKVVTEAYYTFDTKSLSEEDIRKIEDYIEFSSRSTIRMGC